MLSHQDKIAALGEFSKTCRDKVVLGKLSNTCRELNLLFKPALNSLKARELIQITVNGFVLNGGFVDGKYFVEHTYKDVDPSVLLQKVEVEICDQFNRPYRRHMSPLQAVFVVNDPVAMAYMQNKLHLVMRTKEGRDEIAKQIVSINPIYLARYLSRHYISNGLKPKPAYDAKKLADAFLQCSDEKIEEFLKLENTNSTLYQAIEAFKVDFANFTSSELSHNLEHTIKAWKYCKAIMPTNNEKKIKAFADVLIGFMQKDWPCVLFQIFGCDAEEFIARNNLIRADVSYVAKKIDRYGIDSAFYYDFISNGHYFENELDSVNSRIATTAEEFFFKPLQNAFRRCTLMNNEDLMLLFISAINNSNLELFKRIVNENPHFNIAQPLPSENPEYNNAENMLFYALEKRKESIAIFLIQLNKFELIPTDTFERKRNVAHVAATNGCKNVLKHLFTLTELNLKQTGLRGWNLLHFAASTGDFETFSLVLDTGLFDINCLDANELALPVHTVTTLKLIRSKNIEIQKREKELGELKEEVLKLKQSIQSDMSDQPDRTLGAAFRK